MGRLFWKIFLSFWLTLILVLLFSSWGTALYLESLNDVQRETNRDKLVRIRMDAISNAIEYGGIAALKKTLNPGRRPPPAFFELSVSDKSGTILIHKKRRRMPQRPDISIVEVNKIINSIHGDEYKITAKVIKRMPAHPKFGRLLRPFGRFPALALLWFAIAVLISGSVCFWLAWYLTQPIRQLQMATRQLASGKLSTRIKNIMGNRRDEIADLGKDFDHMAEQLQNLLLSQKQLLSDISHELRSPLARLHIALGLTRQKTDSRVHAELDRIEHEAIRLDELIGQVLTLSRLDRDNAYKKEDYIDIATLLEDIVKDANFEAQHTQRSIALVTKHTWTIQANAELLYRALENIIRNAVRYTAENTQVTVTLHAIQAQSNVIQIDICDQGDGIPESHLETIFEPFVRLSSSRNRKSGGYGLGLAIAQRAIHFHNGEVSAINHSTAGLCVTVRLPA